MGRKKATRFAAALVPFAVLAFLGAAQARGDDAVRFKVQNQMGTAIVVRLVAMDRDYTTSIRKGGEVIPNGRLKTGPRAVIVFDDPTGKVLLQDVLDVQDPIVIVLTPDGIQTKDY